MSRSAAHCTFRNRRPGRAVRPAGKRGAALQPPVAVGKRSRLSASYLLGNGSNILFADAGFSGGAVIDVSAHEERHRRYRKYQFPGGKTRLLLTTQVVVGAGQMLCGPVYGGAGSMACTGLEFAYGIPGTVGGAVYMNAGAYGGEMKDVLASVRYLAGRRRGQ